GKGPIHERRAAREISRVFQQSHEEKQNHDLRKENSNGPDTADHAFANESGNDRFGKYTDNKVAGHRKSRVDRVDERLGGPEDCREQRHQNKEKNRKSPVTMQNNPVDPRGVRIRQPGETADAADRVAALKRSEERRVGKEGRNRS